jgi:hypothetical protein
MAKRESRRMPQNRVMYKKTQTPDSNQAEADADLAVKRVYQLFGPDLSVFFNAVQDQARLERHDRRDQEQHAHARVVTP